MPKPVVFISAATIDLKEWRDHLHTAFSRAGFRVLTQDESLGSALGDVRRLLSETVDEADCVLHLAGVGYGAHATDSFPEAPAFRCSWTQFEYYHAHQRGKDVIAFVCAPNLSTPGFTEEADTPDDASLKSRLQQEHRQRVASGYFTGTPLQAQFSHPLDGTPLRTSNEPVTSAGKLMEAVAAAIGTLHKLDREHCEKAQKKLRDLAATLRRLEAKVDIVLTQQSSLGKKLAAAIVLIALLGFGVWMVKRETSGIHSKIDKMENDVAEGKVVFAKERKLMAAILARANENIRNWQNMSPAQRFDLALDQIASEQKIPAKELRNLLDLYVQLVEADPDAEAVDKYNVFMRKQDYDQAAELAGTEAQSAEARMKLQDSRMNAAKALMEQAAQLEKKERQSAVDFYEKKGAADTSAIRYEQALAAYQKAASLVDKATDPLGWAYAQGQVTFIDLHLAHYREAEPLMREIIRVREAQLGPRDPQVATAVNNLAWLLEATNRLAEAEPLMKRALAIDEASLDKDRPKVAEDLNNLATLLQNTNRLAEAEPLLRRALQIDEASLGKDHPDVARDLNNLALLLRDTNRLVEAESLMKRALQIDQASLGKDHPEVATQLNNLALLLQATNRVPEAESLMKRALAIDEASFGKEHPKVALDLNNLAVLLLDTNRLVEAEPLMKRALAIDEASFGKDHPHVARDLNNLAQLFQDTNRLMEAEPLMKRALAIDEASFGKNHPKVAKDLNNLAALFLNTNRLTEAEPLMKRALAIDEASFGKDHPKVARDLNNMAEWLRDTNRLVEAEPLIKRALEIDEASFGKDHPTVAVDLNNLATLLQETNRLAEAEPLMRRALAIDEASVGKDHPTLAIRLGNLAMLLKATDRLAEAEPLMRRALGIIFLFQKRTGHPYPSVVAYLQNYLRLTREMKLPDSEARARLDAERQQAGLDEASFEALWKEVLAANYDGPMQVTITEVLKGGQGEALGLLVGDVYVRYNGVEITSGDQFVKLVTETGGEAIPVEVKRGDQVLKLTAKPGKFGTRIENRPPPAAPAKP